MIIELREIRKKINDKRIFGIGLQGRANMCIIAKNDSEIKKNVSTRSPYGEWISKNIVDIDSFSAGTKKEKIIKLFVSFRIVR